ncbi:MAG: hypothetical protein GT589_06195 [Peptoclostridium sp.]|uniref:metallophosphoesterase family protein n=1 Tax=Peptoclostridium sp. TaxID=1904860 RepID=UPI00139ED80A|nr:metallophosphoesterase family protein [Peptoclostridium sp.]MZQ75739.1 hypothetical protein [Peptoclostridium sp.]
MKIALLSDCHGNIAALESAMKIVESEKLERLYFLGDMIGYYPNPNECLDIAKKHKCLIGNHEYACIHPSYSRLFNPAAQNAIKWTKDNLTSDNIDYISKLPYTLEDADAMIKMAHGALTNPFEYIQSKVTAFANFELFTEQVLFVGHTHRAAVWTQDMNEPYDIKLTEVWESFTFDLENDKRYIINIGSVGQPRDGNPEGCFVIFDSSENTVRFIRFEYPVEVTYQRALDAGMDSMLCNRLFAGI